ncbi:MAG: iron uptake transporter permease EfeU [Moraxella sp.]
MWVALLIMLREGIEAALIVGIVAGFLRQSGHMHLMSRVWTGAFLAALLCTVIGYGIHKLTGEIPQKEQEFVVGVIGLVAVAMLTYMVIWMGKAAKGIKDSLQTSVQSALNQGNKQGWALVLMAFLAVLREGLESVFFLIAVFEQSPDSKMPIGAVAGLLLAALIGWLIYQCGVRINLARFFKITGVFLIFVAAGLFAGSFRALHEAGIWNIGQTVLADFSPILHENSALGVVLSGFLGYTDHPVTSDVVLYFLYLIPALLVFLTGSKTKTA